MRKAVTRVCSSYVCLAWFVLPALLLAASLAEGSLPPTVAKLYTDTFFNGLVRVRNGSAAAVIAAQDFGILSDYHHTDSLRFPVGSNTKLHVALALYQLQESGLVNLTHSIADYLDANDFVAFGWSPNSTYCPKVVNSSTPSCQVITFEQLLGMSSGIPGGPFDNFFVPYAGSIGATVGPYLQAELYFVPGTDFFYSNPSFMLAAYFVEKLSGMELGDYVRKNIWRLASMNDTRYDPYNQQLAEDDRQVAEKFHYIDASTNDSIAWGKCSYELDPGVVNGAGGFKSTVKDEANLYFRLFDFNAMGRPFLKHPSSLLAMVTPRTATGSPRWFAQGVWVMNCADPSRWQPPYPRASSSMKARPFVRIRQIF